MAALTSVGGAYGYRKTGSKASLIAGGVMSVAFGIAGYLINTGEHTANGFALATATSSVLALVMGKRYVSTRVLFPAGSMCAAGVLSATFHGSKYREWTK